MSATWPLMMKHIQAQRVRLTVHGIKRMRDEQITLDDLLDRLEAAVVVEDYADAERGPSVLVRHTASQGHFIHAVWGMPLADPTNAHLVTAYRPDPSRWNNTLIRRLT